MSNFSTKSAARLPEAAYMALGAFSLVVIWAVAHAIWSPPDYLLPSPAAGLTAAISNTSDLYRSASVTMLETVAGFLLACLTGFVAALLLHFWPRLASPIWPALLVIQLTPQVAFAPLLILWFGIGLTSKIIMAASVAFFPIVINTFIGLRSVEASILDLARSMRLSRLQTLAYFELPMAAPHILSGIKISVTYAVVGAVVAEFISSNEGLGHLILVANGSLDAALAIAAVLALSLMGAVLFLLVTLCERRLVFWHISQRSQEHHFDAFGH